MGLKNRMPSVCNALETSKFSDRYGLNLVSRDGPRMGSNAVFTFEKAESDKTLVSGMESNNEYDRLSAKQFEDRVKKWFERSLNTSLNPEKLVVGFEHFHEFDLVSEDHDVVIECKSYTWKKDGNFPSAKVSTANEALFYARASLFRKYFS